MNDGLSFISCNSFNLKTLGVVIMAEDDVVGQTRVAIDALEVMARLRNDVVSYAERMASKGERRATTFDALTEKASCTSSVSSVDIAHLTQYDICDVVGNIREKRQELPSF
jgi:hypothetical protein